MKTNSISRVRGFTLLETVIAIGVLAVLLTGFMVVFAPAADGIRKSINVQQADRMASALEQEIVTMRNGEKTGFERAFKWIDESNEERNAIMAYQYRGEIAGLRTDDNTPKPVSDLKGSPGKDYMLVPMVRRLSDSKFKEDLAAIEGGVYLVRCTQLIFKNGQLSLGKEGDIVDPKAGGIVPVAAYPEAVIAFSADFHQMTAKSDVYFKSDAFKKKFQNPKNPLFSRNLAVRR